MPDPVAGLFDDEDGAAAQRLGGRRQDCFQPLDDVPAPGVLQAEEDHPGGAIAGERSHVPKVEVEREDDSILGQGLREHLLVERPVQPLVPQVNGI